ncbi:MAG: DUF1573 domain-containing protein [Hyphomicrobiales bacterium]
MKNLIYFFILISSFVGRQAFAQEESSKDNSKGAIIKFQKTKFDVKEIAKNDTIAIDFRFTNKGNEPLMLTKPFASCGCTVPEWPKQPIFPGDSDVISVTYKADKIGAVNKKITVYSNATNDKVVLTIVGKVVEKPLREKIKE